MKLFLSMTVFGALAGCMGDATDEDGRDDTFATDGKADGGVTSQEAAAILEVANMSSVSKLRSDVSLAKRTAENIVQARSGAPFTSLAELDAVPWVGPVSLQRLLEYVHSEGLVQPAIPKQWHSEMVAWGYDESMGFLPHGEVVVGHQTSSQLIEAWQGGGSPGTYWTFRMEPMISRGQIALGAGGEQHVFFHSDDYSDRRWRHFRTTSHDATWVEPERLYRIHDLVVNQSQTGDIFALSGYVANSTEHEVSLLAFGSAGGVTSRWVIMTKTANLDQAHLAVDSAGAPSVTYLAESTGVHLARMQAGVLEDELVMETLSSGRVASTGGTDPIVFVAFPYDSVRILQRGQSGFKQVGQFPISSIDALDAAVDGDGIAHLCYVSSSVLYDVQIDSNGAWTQTALGSGRDCQMEAAVDGSVHIVTHDDDDLIRHLVFN